MLDKAPLVPLGRFGDHADRLAVFRDANPAPTEYKLGEENSMVLWGYPPKMILLSYEAGIPSVSIALKYAIKEEDAVRIFRAFTNLCRPDGAGVKKAMSYERVWVPFGAWMHGLRFDMRVSGEINADALEIFRCTVTNTLSKRMKMRLKR